MAGSAMVAYLSSLCSPEFTATQYAILSSLTVVGRTLVASTSGKLSEAMGWIPFWLLDDGGYATRARAADLDRAPGRQKQAGRTAGTGGGIHATERVEAMASGVLCGLSFGSDVSADFFRFDFVVCQAAQRRERPALLESVAVRQADKKPPRH